MFFPYTMSKFKALKSGLRIHLLKRMHKDISLWLVCVFDLELFQRSVRLFELQFQYASFLLIY